MPNPAECPYEVQRPVMIHHWNTLTFLHWRFEPEAVQRLLPPGLEVDARDGVAWVGLVPFFMRVGLPGVGSLPWATRFCETNVRTYVRDAAGRSGIWFFSLDAARMGAVIVARATYRLPYFWSQMELQIAGSIVRYGCTRRWPGPHGASSRVAVTVGDRYESQELTELDHFLTAKWILYSVAGDRRRHAKAQHTPWPLYRAVATECHDELVQAAGLPKNEDPPVVHYSPGVEVRIGRPERDRLSP